MNYVDRIASLLVQQSDRAAVIMGTMYPIMFGRPMTGPIVLQIRNSLAAMVLG